jgi:uncharacterized protein (TIGR02246 family)
MFIFLGCSIANGKNIELENTFQFSINVQIKMQQEKANAVIDQYIQGLHEADVQSILNLYAKDGVSLWDGSASCTTPEQIQKIYADLFKTTGKITDVIFVIEQTEINGDIAVIRAHNKNPSSQSLDRHRSLFVLKREGGTYKILTFMFNDRS